LKYKRCIKFFTEEPRKNPHFRKTLSCCTTYTTRIAVSSLLHRLLLLIPVVSFDSFAFAHFCYANIDKKSLTPRLLDLCTAFDMGIHPILLRFSYSSKERFCACSYIANTWVVDQSLLCIKFCCWNSSSMILHRAFKDVPSQLTMQRCTFSPELRNTIDVHDTQLLKPCIKGDSLSVKISKELYVGWKISKTSYHRLMLTL